MPSARFEVAIPAIRRLHTYALDITVTGIIHTGVGKTNVFVPRSNGSGLFTYAI